MREQERVPIGDCFSCCLVVNLEGNAVSPFVEDGQRVEESRIQYKLDYLSIPHYINRLCSTITMTHLV
jgi:hypothetical protein